MGAQGITTINFGAAPGSFSATTVITGQAGIASGSAVEAWVMPTATSDHSADEHLVDPPKIMAGNIVAGTGFTIYGFASDNPGAGVDASATKLYGLYTVAWVWN